MTKTFSIRLTVFFFAALIVLPGNTSVKKLFSNGTVALSSISRSGGPLPAPVPPPPGFSTLSASGGPLPAPVPPPPGVVALSYSGGPLPAPVPPPPGYVVGA